jgi:DNA-binding GntR family transcriptional regulator
MADGRKAIPSKKKTQAEHAYRVIEEMIVTLQLPPGSRISENSLSKQLQIGRTPVREALLRLGYERMIQILPRAGAIVSEIDLSAQFKLIEVRRELEKILNGRAARLANAEACAAFRKLSARFRACRERGEGDLFVDTDREFNKLTAETAQNQYAADAMGPLQAQTRRFWFLHFKTFGDLARVCQLHEATADAIAAKDEQEARAASDRLVDYVEEYSFRTLRALL